MSLINGTPIKLTYFPLILHFLKVKNLRNIPIIMNSATKSSSVDVMDAFTYEILHNRRKTRTLSYHQTNKEKALTDLTQKSPFLKVENLSAREVDTLLLNAISYQKWGDMNNIILSCFKEQKCPSSDVLVELFSIYSSLGDIKTVTAMKDLCSSVNNNLFLANGGFEHYMAKTYCYKGNLDKGMSLFISVYNITRLRMSIDNMLKEIVWDVVTNRSEASMVILREKLEEFIENWEHYFPMTCFWRSCWLSMWFMHQKLSDEIFDKYEPVRNMITNKISVVSLVLLQQQNEDAILRLLQMLLRHKLSDSYLVVLQILFDYRLNKGDTRGCNEIIRNCRVLGLSLGPEYNQKYLFMLIDGKAGVKPPTHKLTTINEFKLKF